MTSKCCELIGMAGLHIFPVTLPDARELTLDALDPGLLTMLMPPPLSASLLAMEKRPMEVASKSSSMRGLNVGCSRLLMDTDLRREESKIEPLLQ